MYMDLHKDRYDNFTELYYYCYKVAGVIGLIMLKIFGYDKPDAEKHAVNLGIAMQLTNILRDIKEDFGRGRIYLPQDEMKKFGITQEYLSNEVANHSFESFLKFQIERARQYYAYAAEGIKMINCRRSRFVVCAMKDIYAAILSAIERNKYDVFSRRAQVGTAGKLKIALSVLLRGEYI
jgi:phytoene synthase